MRRLLGLALLGLTLLRPASADDVPSFPAAVTSVRVDVVVVDGSDHVVADLTRADFVLREEGVEQAIESCELVDLRDVLARPLRSRPSAPVAAALADMPASARQILIVFDDLHLDPLSATRGRQGLRRFLDSSLREGDQVALASTSQGALAGGEFPAVRPALEGALETLSGRKPPPGGAAHIGDAEAHQLHVLHDETLLPILLRRLVDAGAIPVPPDLSSGRSGRRQSDTGPTIQHGRGYVLARVAEVDSSARIRRQAALDTLRRLLDAMALRQGRKIVLLVSQGFLHDPAEARFAALRDAAERARASIDFLDLRDQPGADPWLAPDVREAIDLRDEGTVRRLARLDAEGSQSLAADTGGRSIRLGRPEDALELASRAADGYYLLGYTPRLALDGTYRRIAVEVRRPGLRVRARPGYRAALPREAPPATGDLHPDLKRALDAALDPDGLTVQAAAYTLAPAAEGRVEVLIVAVVASGGITWTREGDLHRARLETALRTAPLAGGPGQELAHLLDVALPDAERPRVDDAGLPFQRRLELPPGRHRVRLALRDAASGRVGARSLDVEVPPTPLFRIGTPILGDTLRDSRPLPRLDRRFRAGGTLYCGLQVHGAALGQGTSRVSLELEVSGPGGTPFLALEPFELTSADGAPPGRILAVPLADAIEGEYELRLRVLDEIGGGQDERRERFHVEAR
jgi:VWFA-related protein